MVVSIYEALWCHTWLYSRAHWLRDVNLLACSSNLTLVYKTAYTWPSKDFTIYIVYRVLNINLYLLRSPVKCLLCVSTLGTDTLSLIMTTVTGSANSVFKCEMRYHKTKTSAQMQICIGELQLWTSLQLTCNSFWILNILNTFTDAWSGILMLCLSGRKSITNLSGLFTVYQEVLSSIFFPTKYSLHTTGLILISSSWLSITTTNGDIWKRTHGSLSPCILQMI